MATTSVLEQLWQVNPEAEIWWDSSPIIYNNWRNKMVANAADKQQMKTWLDRLYPDAGNGANCLFRGVTTNPPLSYNAIKDDPTYWANWIGEFIRKEQCTCVETVFWETYKEIVRRGAKIFLPLFESSNHKYGYISGQVDPRYRHDVDKMFAMGVEIHSIAPNVMVKIPGTDEGYQVIRRLTALGIPTNNTLSFVISQFVTCMNAVTAGLKEAKANGVDLSTWRSVITAMSARYGNLGDLKKEAAERGITLSEAEVRSAEIAVFKKACRLVEENPDYNGKMLLCSMRMGPQVNGEERCWHLEKAAGANIVYTCPPNFLETLLTKGTHIVYHNEINEPIAQDLMDKLMKIPYFRRGYAEDGYTPQEFNTHPALLATANEFTNVTRQMVDFVARCIIKKP